MFRTLDAFVKLTVHARLTELNEANPKDVSLLKYSRRNLLDTFDALHTRKDFADQSIDMYPERDIPRTVQYKRRQKIDMNEDSDGGLWASDDFVDVDAFAEGGGVSEHEDDGLHTDLDG